ncbi:hypothetical protein G6L29_32055 [Agrobacterium rhizogenes]|uniref:hypothetical protein n=1 Tax=Rhizobium rhizogenes TaxID=359 RepID=UPI0015730C5E|nr:hypothetical protein [Rhizobium rhizogenes]NTG91019.1 hypothetical protein [Rhizobium rhizogenes]NTI20292.1 hypothetical protein [Rhizobium rhizogenes]NTI39340.1 hypothetical protein [Rhizobium rhizogenes]WEO68941.1 hypothetical protein G6L54_022205 [Rhizobium rhizogenes]
MKPLRMIPITILFNAGVLLLTPVGVSQAGGLLGDIIHEIADCPGPGCPALDMDRTNESAGRPVGVVPAPPSIGFGSSQNVLAPTPSFPPEIGNFCTTPAGRFGPGPILPIGSPCIATVPGVGPGKGFISK